MAPDSAQTIANAASAVHTAPVNSRCEKTSPARTNRFLTHCRGRIEITIALSIAIAAKRASVESCSRSRGGGSSVRQFNPLGLRTVEADDVGRGRQAAGHLAP